MVQYGTSMDCEHRRDGWILSTGSCYWYLSTAALVQQAAVRSRVDILLAAAVGKTLVRILKLVDP